MYVFIYSQCVCDGERKEMKERDFVGGGRPVSKCMRADVYARCYSKVWQLCFSHWWRWLGYEDGVTVSNHGKMESVIRVQIMVEVFVFTWQ